MRIKIENTPRNSNFGEPNERPELRVNVIHLYFEAMFVTNEEQTIDSSSNANSMIGFIDCPVDRYDQVLCKQRNNFKPKVDWNTLYR